jgi:hypothetical protein
VLSVFLLSFILQAAPPDDPAASHFYSYFAGERFHTAVTRADLDAAPKWTEGTEAPPLSPKAAVEAARARFATLVPDADKWSVESISLRPVGPRHDWLYVIQFDAPPPSDPGIHSGGVPWFQVVVLFNGIAIEPSRQPWRLGQ